MAVAAQGKRACSEQGRVVGAVGLMTIQTVLLGGGMGLRGMERLLDVAVTVETKSVTGEDREV